MNSRRKQLKNYNNAKDLGVYKTDRLIDKFH